jgi:hypothetical protein
MPIASRIRVIAWFEILHYICFWILAIDALGSFRTKAMRFRLKRFEYLSGRPGRGFEVPLLRNRSREMVSQTVESGILSSFAIWAGFLPSSTFLMILPLI